MEIIGSINNCYNIATVTGKSYVGAITSARTITVSNCGYLTGNATYGNGYKNSDTGCTIYNTIEEMPTVMEIVNVGSHYKEDTNNINGGYPILSWQSDKDKLNLINGNNAFVEDTEGINGGFPILAWQVK